MYGIFDYYASNGGLINGAIFCVAVLVFYVGMGKVIQLRALKKARIRYPVTAHEKNGNTLYFDFLGRDLIRETGHTPEYYRNKFREILLKVIPNLNSCLDTMAAFVQAAPLLGLFGTVAGMIKTFSLITVYGTANPVILTEGITISLLTTQAGLLVAFPCLLFHNYVNGKKDALLKEIIAQGESIINGLKERDEHAG